MIEFLYDGFGRRVITRVNGEGVRHIYDGYLIAQDRKERTDELVAEYTYFQGNIFKIKLRKRALSSFSIFHNLFEKGLSHNDSKPLWAGLSWIFLAVKESNPDFTFPTDRWNPLFYANSLANHWAQCIMNKLQDNWDNNLRFQQAKKY